MEGWMLRVPVTRFGSCGTGREGLKRGWVIRIGVLILSGMLDYGGLWDREEGFEFLLKKLLGEEINMICIVMRISIYGVVVVAGAKREWRIYFAWGHI
jgi:hypothetical protein